jgi:hypothetical protein
MKMLIGFEASGVVRRAFAAKGHDVWSCDIRPSDDGSNHHIQDDIRNVIDAEEWDFLGIFHPPCTRLCNSGVRWLHVPPPGKTKKQMWAELDDGCELFSLALNCKIPKKCVENPKMHMHAKKRIKNFRPASQHVQPWQFGHPEFKLTGFYLEGLDPLEPTRILRPPKPGTDEHKKWSRVHRARPGPDRWLERSKFFPGIARAMAEQWG